MIDKVQNTKTREMLGITLILILLFVISNFSDAFLVNLFSLQKPDAVVYFINRLLLWGPILLLYIFTRKVLKQKFLIWEEKKQGFLFHTISILCMLGMFFVGLVIIASVLDALQFNSLANNQLDHNLVYKNNFPLLLFTAFTAGVLEEILFRGYIQPRIKQWTKSSLWSILITSLIFGLMHISLGTLHQVLIPFFFSMVLSAFYAKYRNLKAVIITHFLWDIFSLLDSAYNG